jgi:hypothetical protein
MHKPKPYKCLIRGAEIPDLPMPVLKHQMSHVRRRPFARDRRATRINIPINRRQHRRLIWNAATSASCRPAPVVR